MTVAASHPVVPVVAGPIVVIEKGIDSFENEFLALRVDRVRFPDGREGIYNVLGSTHGDDSDAGAAMTVLVAQMGGQTRFGLTRQFRYPIGEFSIEFPGGGVLAHTAVEAAREVFEEVGVLPERIEKLGVIHELASVRRAVTSIWLAHVNLPDGMNAPHVDEETGGVSMWVDREELVSLIRGGFITDSATLSAWALYALCT